MFFLSVYSFMFIVSFLMRKNILAFVTFSSSQVYAVVVKSNIIKYRYNSSKAATHL